jgi:hypothetical protein
MKRILSAVFKKLEIFSSRKIPEGASNQLGEI